MSVKYFCDNSDLKSDKAVKHAALPGVYDSEVITDKSDLPAVTAEKCGGIYVRPCVTAKSSSVAAKLIADAEKAENDLIRKKHDAIMRVKEIILSVLFALIFSLIISFFSFGISRGFAPLFIIMLGVFMLYFAFKGKIIRQDIE